MQTKAPLLATAMVFVALDAGFGPTVTGDGGGDGIVRPDAANGGDGRLPASTNGFLIHVPIH